MIIGGKAREDTPHPLAPGGQVAAAAALAHGFSRGATRVPRCRSNHKSPARENTQMVKIPEIPGLIRPCHRKSSSGSRSFSPRLQPWETRHERPCATGIPGARYQARGYPIGMPVEKATPRKKTQTWFSQQTGEYPLSLGRQTAAAAALAHGFSRGATRPERPGTPGGPTRATKPGVTQSRCPGKKSSPRKKTQTWFSQQTGEYPLSSGGHVVAAVSRQPTASVVGQRAPSGRAPRAARREIPCQG